MRVTIAILLTLSALALGKIERMRMPRGLCSLYTDVGKQYKKPGNTKTQQEVQSLALRQYLWSSSSSTIKIPDATVKWLESLDREIYNLASQQGRKKRQATWYRGQRKEIRKLNEMERNQVFDCLKQLKATTVSIQFLKTLNHVAKWTGWEGNKCLVDPRIKLLPDTSRPKSTVCFKGLAKRILPEKPVDKCFVLPFDALSGNIEYFIYQQCRFYYR